MNAGEELVRTLVDAAGRLGVTLQGDLNAVREYAGERMLHLSTIVDEPGYGEALLAEATSVALRAAGAAVDAADALDRELLGIVSGALAIGARGIAG